MTPSADVKKRLESENKELQSDVSNLEKKLHYLETTFKNSRSNLDKVLQSGSR
jgi:prefoldin subunit 1